MALSSRTRQRHVLYRFYDDLDQLLYVGITSNPAQRFEKHRHEKDWWDAVARIEMEHFSEREALLAAERTAIETEKPLHNVAMNRREADAGLVWTCEACGEPIADGAGWLSVDELDIARHRQWNREFNERKRKENPDGLIVTNLAELNDCPPRAAWRAWHRACDPDPEAEAYWFDIELIRTLGQLIGWCAHLGEKNWINDTNWFEVLYRFAEHT